MTETVPKDLAYAHLSSKPGYPFEFRMNGLSVKKVQVDRTVETSYARQSLCLHATENPLQHVSHNEQKKENFVVLRSVGFRAWNQKITSVLAWVI